MIERDVITNEVINIMGIFDFYDRLLMCLFEPFDWKQLNL